MTKTVIPIFQRAEDLQLAIVLADVLPETTIMQAHRIQHADWQIDFVIIGESHRVRIQNNHGVFFEELLACIDIEAEACSHYHDFADLAEHHYQHNNYCIQTSFLDRIPAETNAKDCLEYRFPKINDIQPITRIVWTIENNTLHWQTMHVYVEAEKIICVHTQSEFHFFE